MWCNVCVWAQKHCHRDQTVEMRSQQSFSQCYEKERSDWVSGWPWVFDLSFLGVMCETFYCPGPQITSTPKVPLQPVRCFQSKRFDFRTAATHTRFKAFWLQVNFLEVSRNLPYCSGELRRQEGWKGATLMNATHSQSIHTSWTSHPC